MTESSCPFLHRGRTPFPLGPPLERSAGCGSCVASGTRFPRIPGWAGCEMYQEGDGNELAGRWSDRGGDRRRGRHGDASLPRPPGTAQHGGDAFRRVRVRDGEPAGVASTHDPGPGGVANLAGRRGELGAFRGRRQGSVLPHHIRLAQDHRGSPLPVCPGTPGSPGLARLGGRGRLLSPCARGPGVLVPAPRRILSRFSGLRGGSFPDRPPIFPGGGDHGGDRDRPDPSVRS